VAVLRPFVRAVVAKVAVACRGAPTTINKRTWISEYVRALYEGERGRCVRDMENSKWTGNLRSENHYSYYSHPCTQTQSSARRGILHTLFIASQLASWR
jgi:hypothetical protein